MKILVIHGSPRIHGNTYQLVAKIETEMKQLDTQIEFDWVFLSQEKLEPCKGCYRCLEYGEDQCSIQDNRALIEQKMHDADGVIFTSPVYVANVSALFKNFIDRFAYICHRPRFHHKKAMVVSTTGGIAAGIVNIIMKVMLETWGFDVFHKVGAIVTPGITEVERINQGKKNDDLAKKAARVMIAGLRDHSTPKATLKMLCTFRLQKASFGYAAKDKIDYQYWQAKGWLDPNVVYYVPAKINPIKLFLAKLLTYFEIKKYPKQNG